MMETITLSNGVEIPQIGLGVWQSPKGEATEHAVMWALEAGYRHIDTARIYGNEASVGAGIRKSGVARKDIFLTTKLWNEDIRKGRAKEAFEESLDRLETDYVDLYLIHWPAEGFEKAWQDMTELYEAGRIRAIGVSNFQPHHLETLEKVSSVVPMVNQIESNLYFNNQTVIDYCHARHIAVEAYSPLGGTGGHILEDEKLLAMAEKYGKTPAQIILRWDIQRGLVVLPKSTHKERIISNLDVFDFELDPEDEAALSDMDRGIRTGADPDHFDF